MGKGEGNGEGWGEGQGKGGEWKGDLCSSCNAGPKCKYILHVLYHTNFRRFLLGNPLSKSIKFDNKVFCIFLGFVSCCCPMVGNYFVAEKIGADGFEKFIGFLDCLGFGGLCSAIGATSLRGKVREKDGIEGDGMKDCCASFCCLACVQCQMATHVGLDD